MDSVSCSRQNEFGTVYPGGAAESSRPGQGSADPHPLCSPGTLHRRSRFGQSPAPSLQVQRDPRGQQASRLRKDVIESAPGRPESANSQPGRLGSENRADGDSLGGVRTPTNQHFAQTL
jgi:hypothetical protein